jgi:hypothetical protein
MRIRAAVSGVMRGRTTGGSAPADDRCDRCRGALAFAFAVVVTTLAAFATSDSTGGAPTL